MPAADPLLFAERNTCCACGASVTRRRGRIPFAKGDANILTVTPLLYVVGKRRKLKKAPGFHICDRCFVLAIGGTCSKLSLEGVALWGMLRGSLSLCYNVALDEVGAR